MTCEVVVANKNGLALAADSAVTLGPQRKVYHSAEKLFRLSESEPVAIMTYGAAEMMGVPWDTIIKIYRKGLGARRYDYVAQYAEDFLRFLESANPLFPEEAQRRHLKHVVGDYTRSICGPVWERFGSNTNEWPQDAWPLVVEQFARDHDIWNNYGTLSTSGPGLGQTVVARHSGEIDECERWLFDDIEPPAEIRSALRHTVSMMYEKEWISPAENSGIVIAGFGEREVFPRVEHLQIGSIAAGRLRYIKLDGAVIDHDQDGWVTPFAQRQMIDSFYSGMHPLSRDVVDDVFAASLTESLSAVLPEADATLAETVQKAKDTFWERVNSTLYDRYTSPLTAAVSALPLNELASLSEALVSLTEFRARMSAAEAETVGGEIDVAVISKGDGFMWVKRKGLMGRARIDAARSSF